MVRDNKYNCKWAFILSGICTLTAVTGLIDATNWTYPIDDLDWTLGGCFFLAAFLFLIIGLVQRYKGDDNYQPEKMNKIVGLKYHTVNMMEEDDHENEYYS
jgi:hypothetical protein